jgi:hypothetical protein
MTPWEVALQITKFIALAIAAASGVYATIADTRDKESGELKPAGRVVLTCVILSLVVGLTSQALDTKSTIDKLKNEASEKKTAADREEAQRRIDEAARTEQMTQLQSILGTAQDASAQSKASATQSATAVQGLSAITAAQSIGLEKSWRQERPFGQWKAELTVKGVHLHLDDDWVWIERILAYSRQPDVSPDVSNNLLVIMPGMDIYPSHDRDEDIRELWGSSQVSFAEPRDPYQYGVNPKLLGFYLELTSPGIIVAHINDDKNAVTSFDLRFMVFSCKQEVGTPNIRNWIDLYGREMTLDLYGELAAAENIYFSLYYEDTNDSHKLTYACERCGHATVDTSIILTEKELGEFPSDYKALFPSEFKKIEDRMRTARLGAAK